MKSGSQSDLFLDSGPEGALDAATTRRALDELFCLTQQYKSTQSYCDLLLFVANFRFYAPYNAMLIHIQRPGAKFVCSPSRWLDDFKREIKPGSSPLLILRPMGPVMFVFDVLDTIPLPGAPPLPDRVESPFEVSGTVEAQFEKTIGNALRDGVEVSPFHGGSQQAGQIAPARTLDCFTIKRDPSLSSNLCPFLCDMNCFLTAVRSAKFSTPRLFMNWRICIAVTSGARIHYGGLIVEVVRLKNVSLRPNQPHISFAGASGLTLHPKITSRDTWRTMQRYLQSV